MRRRVIAMGAALAALAIPTAVGGAGLGDAGSAAAASVDSGATGVGGGVGDPVAPHRGRNRADHRGGEVSRSDSRAAETTDPLSVTIDQLSPGTILTTGDIRVSGVVTNDSDDTWTTVKLYPFVSDAPLTTAAQLDAAAATDPDAEVGSRIVDDTHNATVDVLAPGQSASYDFSVPRKALGVSSPGVYWFGVHALGQGPEGRDTVADGRARTFLPLIPQSATGALPISVVLPLRRPIGYADDGSLTDTDGWLQTLSEGGRLRSVVDLGGTAGADPVSWLVDPALVDAVRRLAAGNPARSIAANLTAGQTDPDTPTSGASPSDTAADQPDPSASPGSGSAASDADGRVDDEPAPLSQARLAKVDARTRELALAAQDWLSRLGSAVKPGDELLVLPYGDTDVAGAASHDAKLYRVARTRSDGATILPGLDGVQVAPAVGSPSGYLSSAALDLLDPETTTLVSDRSLRDPTAGSDGSTTESTTESSTDSSTDGGTSAAAVASAGGHDLVMTSTSAAAGGPGPDDPQATTAMRQRLVAEAAVRFLGPDPQPLVVLMPHDWNPREAAGFFSGLDASWTDLSTVTASADAAQPTTVDSSALRYPASQVADELDAANFEATTRLMASGSALQSLLTLNNQVSGTVTDEALSTASYSARTHPDANRLAADRSRSWISARLRRVTVSAPTAVTLSSSTGRFDTTVRNGLDQPVTVALDARTDARLKISGPRRVQVPPGEIATVHLRARTDENGVHQVVLRVTDQRGVSLGGVTDLSIRSAQVSGVIWLFLAIGAVLLFGTIAVRLWRRVRDARRRPGGRDPEDTGHTEDAGPAASRPSPRPAEAGSR